MKIVGNLTRSTKDAFWDVVEDCLADIFQVPPAVASSACKDRRADVEFAPKSVKSNIYYHREPFDVANDIAIRLSPSRAGMTPTLDDPATGTKYEQILARHGLAP